MEKLDHKLECFFAAERKALAALTPPDDFDARLRDLVSAQQAAAAAENLSLTDSATTKPERSSPPVRVLPRPRMQHSRGRWQALLAAVAAAVLILVSIGNFLPQSGEWPEHFGGLVEIRPVYASDSGVGTEQGFVITSTEPLGLDLVDKSLTIEPAFDYTLEEAEQNTYIVVPEEPLAENTVYRLSFDPQRSQEDKPVRAEYSWAFQTEPAFAVSEISPANTAVGVPLQSTLALTFNAAVGLDAVAAVTIDPAVEGTWQATDNCLIFTPSLGWLADTTYEVVLAESLPALDGQSLQQTWVSQFVTTAAVPGESFSFALTQQARLGGAFGLTEAPYWSVCPLNETAALEYQVSVYQICDSGAYLAALQQYLASLSWSKAAEAAALDASVWPLWQSWQVAAESSAEQVETVRLPQALPSGYYLAELQRDGCTRQVLFQVSSITAYAALGTQQSLFWLHDQAGQPVANAQISQYDQDLNPLGVSNESGLIVVDTPQLSSDTPQLYLLEQEGKELVLATEAEQQQDAQSRLRNSYWYAVNLAQMQYQPGDTLQYCGVLQAVDSNAASYSTASLRLSGGALSGDLTRSYAVEAADGSFSGSLQLPALQAGWYALELYVDDVYLTGKYFYIGQIDQEHYQVTVEPVHAVAEPGETAVWQIEASYRGLPLRDVELSWQNPFDGSQEQIITDQNGLAQIAITAAAATQTGPLANCQINLTASHSELGQLDSSFALTVLQAAVDAEIQLERLSATDYRLQLQALDLQIEADGVSEYTRQGDLCWNVEVINNSGAAGEVNEAQDENEHEPELTAQIEQQLELWTHDGDWLVYEGQLGTTADYSLRLQGQDDAGRSVNYELSLAGWQEQLLVTPILRDQNRLPQDDAPYQPGEAINLQLYQEQSLLAPEAVEQTLFVLTYEDELTAWAGEQTNYDFTYQQPVVSCWAVCYRDGRYVVSEVTQLLGAQQAGGLDLQLETNRDSYASGETAHVNLQLNDGEGQPVSGVVNFNLVPRGQNRPSYRAPELQPHYFRNLFSHQEEDDAVWQDMSNDIESAQLPAEAEVQTSAFFATVRTEADGAALLDLELPAADQAWLLCWQAYADGQTNQGYLELPTYTAFQIEYLLAEQVLAGDTPELSFRAVGEAMAADEPVSYQLSLDGLSQPESYTATAGEWLRLQLPSFGPGSYSLCLEAQSGDSSDCVFLTLQVLESGIQHNQLNSQILSAGLSNLGETSGNVTLIFSNQEKAETIKHLYDFTDCFDERLDQRLAAYAASDLLTDLTGWQNEDLPQDRYSALNAYQNSDGGLSYLPGGSSDRMLSVMAATLVGDYLDRAALIGYLRQWESEQEGEQALALWGLASLGQPVLLEIEQMLAGEVGGEARLYLAMAQFACGNGMAAKEEVAQLLNLYTEVLDNGQMRVSADMVTDPQLVTKGTASLALLATAFELPQADALYDYLQAQEDQSGFLLELVRILRVRAQTLQQPAYFSYQLAGQQFDVSLEEYSLYSLQVDQQEISGLSFQGVAGDVVLTYIWQADGLPQMPETTMMQLQRCYDGRAREVELYGNDFVEVRLDYSFDEDTPPGHYTLVESLPAGLEFCHFDSQASSSNTWLLQEQDGILRFSVDKEGWDSLSGSIVYMARCAFPGLYQAEAAYLYHNQDRQLYTQSLPVTIQVNR